jgi:hypothetical protein
MQRQVNYLIMLKLINLYLTFLICKIEYHNFGKYLTNQGLLILTSNHKHLSNIY